MGDRAADLRDKLRALVSEWRQDAAPSLRGEDDYSAGERFGLSYAADDLERLLDETDPAEQESEQGPAHGPFTIEDAEGWREAVSQRRKGE